MTALDRWLEQATRQLSQVSAAQVRREIQEHYDSAREAAMANGAVCEDADRLAVAALGDARAANRQYRRVLLTAAEARVLNEGNREAHAICSRAWVKWVMLAVPATLLLAAFVLCLFGAAAVARSVLLGAVAMAFFFAAPFLPIYTVGRARAYRLGKWAMLTAVLCMAFGPDPLKYSWLLASCVWIPIWTEWTRYSIRRKLPMADWPKQLYL